MSTRKEDDLMRVKLRRAIRTSGLSRARFARTVLLRSPRTLRRWLKGEYEIPPTVRVFLTTYNPEGKA